MTETHNNIHDNTIKSPSEMGAYLKTVRLQRNFTEDDIYKHLKIKARIITAIENHHYTNLPDTVTVAALIRQYAAFLGLDGVEISSNYKNEMTGIDHKIEVIFPDKLPSSFKPFKQSIFVTIVGVLLYFVWRLLNNTENLLPTIIPQHDAPVTALAQEQPKAAPQLFDSVISPQTYEAVSQEIIPVVHFKIIRTPDILINAINGDSWIEIKDIKKQIIFSGVLKKGQTYKIPVDIVGLRLKAGNTAPLSITVNNDLLPILPKTNRVLRDFDINTQTLLKLYNDYKSNIVHLRQQ